jgi:hypothetical protein
MARIKPVSPAGARPPFQLPSQATDPNRQGAPRTLTTVRTLIGTTGSQQANAAPVV